MPNALLALAVGEECGVSPEDARQGLMRCQPPPMRMQLRRLGGIRLLDDSYNANLDSVTAALDTLARLPCDGKRWAVLGEMAEQGVHSEEAHEEVGRKAGELGVNRLVTIGRWAEAMAVAARATGLAEVHVFGGVDEAAEVLPNWFMAGDLILVKGSRVAGLERFVAALHARFRVANTSG